VTNIINDTVKISLGFLTSFKVASLAAKRAAAATIIAKVIPCTCVKDLKVHYNIAVVATSGKVFFDRTS